MGDSTRFGSFAATAILLVGLIAAMFGVDVRLGTMRIRAAIVPGEYVQLLVQDQTMGTRIVDVFAVSDKFLAESDDAE